ncbi:MAG: bifunctional 23S rRNA (guanine(2069)-N(7))-methyltransferase RlmK/23S rRNA (guanine(2445)-N(2))-methyltransferase RlmL [Pseudohongiellaceae bacterium]|nr:bifunctional 23S rRNA (guanine(2069)-N(7))-methyltransferase RlmK/23S rRNA (guanine(2445)-N(2))-methyltransferase RlmL [Pseudohongiellaceae bacterium]
MSTHADTQTSKPSLSLWVSCSKGLETLLEQELRACGIDELKMSVAGIYCKASFKQAYSVIMFSRLCNRVILLLAQGNVEDASDLYDCASAIDWPHHLTPGQTLLINASGSTDQLIHTQFIAQKIKDAIVDQFRSKDLERPNVSREAPDLLIHAIIKKGVLNLGIDLVGSSLHRRNYRIEQGEAPLKETLAAALLMRAGWPLKDTPSAVLYDPMCGSGTLLIEGGLMAMDVAPGLIRKTQFSPWPHHDLAAIEQVQREAEQRREAGAHWQGQLIGSDSDERVIDIARRNAFRANLSKHAQFSVASIEDLTLEVTPNLLICNPPYAERLGEQTEVELLYSALGEFLRREAKGADAAIFTAKPEWGKLLGIHSHKQYAFFNGALPAKLLLMHISDKNIYKNATQGPSKGADSQATVLDEGAKMFANRLRKNLKNIGRWARQQGHECFRLYDADMPEYAFAIDCYGDHIHMQEYKAPASISEADAAQRRRQAYQALCLVMEQSRGIPSDKVILKVREKQRGNEQYRPSAEQGHDFVVTEGDAQFQVNLERYLDTGLFLDHRPIRQWIAQHSRGCRFLNLFCYTATASVHAALGGAASSVSVDLSKTYLNWAAQNFALNDIDTYAHKLEQGDCLKYLQTCKQEFDLIFLDPPTFSNSKSTENVLDIQRDHVELINLCMGLLPKNGLLIFSNNNRRFKLDESIAESFKVEDCSAASIDKDFARNSKIHQCWFIRH